MVHEKNISERIAALSRAASRLRERAEKKAPFSLAFLTDAARISEPLLVIAKMPAGSALIFRDYKIAERQSLAGELAHACKAHSVLFIVAGDDRLAHAVGADGVHWPSWQMDRDKPDGMIALAACHNLREIKAAEQAGADGVFISPIFTTKSHPGSPVLGIEGFSRLAQASGLPTLALGGITDANVHALDHTMASGFGAIGAFQKHSTNSVGAKKE